MSERLPFLKFYPGDWMQDAALRTCSVAARGLWIDVLSAMHANTNRRGYLELPTGRPMLSCHVARIVGTTEQETEVLLAELEDAGVFSRTKDGTIYSRRMVRDDRQLQDDVKNGRRGGNPRLKGGVNPPVNPPVNPEANPPLKARSQKSEVRSQNQEEEEEPRCGPAAPPAELRQWAAEQAKRPDWLPTGKPWITAAVWLKLGQAVKASGTVTLDDYAAIVREARDSRHTLSNPAAFIVARLKALTKGTQ